MNYLFQRRKWFRWYLRFLCRWFPHETYTYSVWVKTKPEEPWHLENLVFCGRCGKTIKPGSGLLGIELNKHGLTFRINVSEIDNPIATYHEGKHRDFGLGEEVMS